MYILIIYSLYSYKQVENDTHHYHPLTANWSKINVGIQNYLEDFKTREAMMEECTHYGGTLDGGGCDTKNYVADAFFMSVLLFFGMLIN